MASDRYQGIPELIYGTAFKFDTSATLTEAALKAGFRGIDTAGSLSAYREKLVGEGIRNVLSDTEIVRKDLWIQTKFTPFKPGKDPKLYPYDVTLDIEAQVQQSYVSSCQNLNTDYLDCLVLHSLYDNINDTLRAWKEMETLVPAKVASLGVSNTDVNSLKVLYDAATVKPRVVQNRFTEDTAAEGNPKMPPGIPFPEMIYDRDVRAFCAEKSITYTPWGLLWGNPTLVDETDILKRMAEEVGVSKEITLYSCMRSLGGCDIRILCGTRKVERMSKTVQGLEIVKRYLTKSEANSQTWNDFIKAMKETIDGI